MSHKTGGYTKHRPRKCPIRKMPIEYAKYPQLYGSIEQIMGNCQFKIMTLDGELKTASPRNTIKKQAYLKLKDWVLIEPLSSNEDGKYQIIFKYTTEQYKNLEKEGCLKKPEDPYKKSEKIEMIQNINMTNNMDDDIVWEGEEEAKESNIFEITNDCIDLI